MPDYNGFFLGSTTGVVLYETLDFTHPSMTRYVFVRNNAYGINVPVPPGGNIFFQYYPFNLEEGENTDDLDQTLTITLGDVGQTLPIELDKIAAAASFNVKPTVVYRSFRSDDMSGPVEQVAYQIDTITPGHDSVTITASAPKLNNNGTGEIYSYDRFPMLKGFN